MFNVHESKINQLYLPFLSVNKFVIYTDKQIIIVVQANPNTKPGGVQGALSIVEYQSDVTPGLVQSAPMAKPVKFRNKKPKRLKK